MAVPQNNMDKFEEFFRRADVDGDGRITGNEAVTFFQASNLPKQVLAQVSVSFFCHVSGSLSVVWF